jgi:hypothetical protein
MRDCASAARASNCIAGRPSIAALAPAAGGETGAARPLFDHLTERIPRPTMQAQSLSKR